MTDAELDHRVVMLMTQLKSPKEICRELGINTDQLRKAIRRSFKKTAAKVVQRFAARAVPIDKAAIRNVVDRDLAPQIKRWLERHPHSDQPLGSSGGRGIAEASFYIDSVDGTEQLRVDVLVVVVRAQGKKFPVLGGSSGKRRWENGEATVQVVLNLNGAMSAEEYLSHNEQPDSLAQFRTNRFQPLSSCTSYECVPYGLYAILIHEATHAAEAAFFKGLQYEYEAETHKVKDQRAYVNDPQEVRAFMQQVVDETVRYGSKLLTHFKGRRLIEKCLKLSTTWSLIEEDLKPTNRNKILSAVHQAFKEEGLLE